MFSGVAFVVMSQSFGVFSKIKSRTHPPTRYASNPASSSVSATTSTSFGISNFIGTLYVIVATTLVAPARSSVAGLASRSFETQDIAPARTKPENAPQGACFCVLCARQDSNPEHQFRRLMLYPFHHGRRRLLYGLEGRTTTRYSAHSLQSF